MPSLFFDRDRFAYDLLAFRLKSPICKDVENISAPVCIFNSSVHLSPLNDWVVKETWATIQQQEIVKTSPLPPPKKKNPLTDC